MNDIEFNPTRNTEQDEVASGEVIGIRKKEGRYESLYFYMKLKNDHPNFRESYIFKRGHPISITGIAEDEKGKETFLTSGHPVLSGISAYKLVRTPKTIHSWVNKNYPLSDFLTIKYGGESNSEHFLLCTSDLRSGVLELTLKSGSPSLDQDLGVNDSDLDTTKRDFDTLPNKKNNVRGSSASDA